MRPLLSLVMIVKDEALNIQKTLDSVLPYIDRWTIIDTGSTDDTPKIVHNTLRALPGTLFVEPFVDFGTTRNRALELDALPTAAEAHAPLREPAVFTLMLSGDETLEEGEALRAFLEEHRGGLDGAYYVQMVAGTQTWPFPRILRTDAGWRYVGVVQEQPIAPSGPVAVPHSPARVVHRLSDPERRKRRVRELDLPLLTKAVADDSKSYFERARDMFFLAETHSAVAADGPQEIWGPALTHRMLAMSFYWRHATLMETVSDDERDKSSAMFSYFRYFNLAEKVGLYSSVELAERLAALAAAAPGVPEIRYMLAVHSAKVDARQGMFLAEEAARVAREATAGNSLMPVDNQTEWRALFVAHECAKALNSRPRAVNFALRAVTAGAPRQLFEGYLDEPTEPGPPLVARPLRAGV